MPNQHSRIRTCDTRPLLPAWTRRGLGTRPILLPWMWLENWNWRIVGREAQASLVPRPSPAPVFAYCKQSNTGAGESLGTRLGSGHQVTQSYSCMSHTSGNMHLFVSSLIREINWRTYLWNQDQSIVKDTCVYKITSKGYHCKPSWSD